MYPYYPMPYSYPYYPMPYPYFLREEDENFNPEENFEEEDMGFRGHRHHHNDNCCFPFYGWWPNYCFPNYGCSPFYPFSCSPFSFGCGWGC